MKETWGLRVIVKSQFKSVTLKKHGRRQKKCFKKRTRTFEWDLYVYVYIYIYILKTFWWVLFFFVFCRMIWSKEYFQGIGFVDSPEVHHKSKVWHHNDTIYCHDPIKQSVQRVQKGCQYGGIHHLRCSSVFVQTNHQVISSQTDSPRFFSHKSSWKTSASTSPIMDWSISSQQRHNFPKLRHIGDVHCVVHQADARGSTALRGTGAGEDCQIRGPCYGSGCISPHYPPNLNTMEKLPPKQTPSKKWEKKETHK